LFSHCFEHQNPSVVAKQTLYILSQK